MRATASSTAARHEHGPTGPIRGHTPLLQRKCACGGSAGLTGKCADCAARESEAGLGVVPLQAKLIVGAADDPYEREADRIADEVMRMPEPVEPRAPLPITPLVHRAVVQRQSRGAGTAAQARPARQSAAAQPRRVAHNLTFAGNCQEYERCNVIEPRRVATQLVDNALAELAPLAAGTTRAGRIVDLLNVHFHDPSDVAGRANLVLANFTKIKVELGSNLPFDCHPPSQDCASQEGPVGAFTGDQSGDVISLCSGYYSSDCLEQARILIHEVCHHIPETRIDHAYVHEPAYMALPADQASENPDTYAQFAKMVTLGTPSCANCSTEVQLTPGQY